MNTAEICGDGCNNPIDPTKCEGATCPQEKCHVCNDHKNSDFGGRCREYWEDVKTPPSPERIKLYEDFLDIIAADPNYQ